jgi:hypothetical protein
MRNSTTNFRLPLLLLFVATGTAATPSVLDPLRVAPHIYDIAFENDKVRVLKATIRNGETPPLHAHPDRVIVYLNPCAWLEDDGANSTRMRSHKFGEPVWAPAETHGGVTANVVEQCSVLEIELK